LAKVVGLNKYSHNTAVAIIDVESGRLEFASEKERLTRAKNDGGACGDLVRAALASCDATLEDVVGLAQNNHHSSIAADEFRWANALAAGVTPGVDGDVFDDANVLASVQQRTEVSHHLAHALGAAWGECSSVAPATVVVMDGMGECAARLRDAAMHSDAHLQGFADCVHALDGAVLGRDFSKVPGGARECESAYVFENGQLRPLFKRWCLANDGALGYNDWFLAPLDSVGAAYSAVSHVVFGDWNACGKVMGLAPWADPTGAETVQSWGNDCLDWAVDARSAVEALDADSTTKRIFRGAVWAGGDAGTSLAIDRNAIRQVLESAARHLSPDFEELPAADLWKASDTAAAAGNGDRAKLLRACCAVLAFRAQRELEEATLPFVDAVVAACGAPEDLKATEVIVCGGVALNSVLNGRIESKYPFLKVPCAPGDEGVALGCAVHALHRADASKKPDLSLLPYSGCLYDELDHQMAIEEFQEWLLPVGVSGDDDAVLEACAAVVEGGNGAVFWFDGRSEFGPRALGHRSIVASASEPRIVDAINEIVKQREDFRPLAPSLLQEDAALLFSAPFDSGKTPYMSRVWRLSEAAQVPGCAHVDGTARPQTVGSTPARYRLLLEAVKRKTRRGIVINTSFNTKRSEPIVESPRGAVSSFLEAARRNTAHSKPLAKLVLSLGPGLLFSPAYCPIDEATGKFKRAKASNPRRRHASWVVRREVDQDGDDRAILLLQDLDEPLEDATRTSRGRFVFTDELEALIYERCDGETAAAELAEEFAEDAIDDAVSAEDVYLRLARLWRHNLVQLHLQSKDSKQS